ncbi:Outer membrane protein HofH [Helicobacter ailurogastricus]|uniref:outer membrane family protein n=1 Tax=Helicobacter ailurogastricus TaxID=1578720 RepID=UPI00244D8C46|nr:outer membrane family protein [Helicobacter ailurogastricus]GMB89593.1 Outer membrane protein HofH [Helicobacter ailurogastricus]
MQDRHETQQDIDIKSNFSVLAYVCGSLIFFASSLDAFEYKFSGRAEQTSQIGFNTRAINRRRGLYPMQQYATVAGYLDLSFSLLPQKSPHSLKGGVGGMVGGVFYDSTKKLEGGSEIYNLYGFYDGYLGGSSNVLSTDSIDIKNNKKRALAKTYIWSDAFLEYQYKDVFGIKGGRYTSTMPYRSGKTQGFEAFGQYKHARLIWFSSFGRAIVGSGFLINWYAPRTSYSGNWTKNARGGWTPHGYQLSYGTHATRLIYNNHKFLAEFFYYFSPKVFNAPGFQFGWDTNPNFDGKGFRSDSHIIAIFPMYEPWMVLNNKGAPIYKYDNPITPTGQSLILRQRFDYNNFYLVGTFYKNFGNTNAYVGNMGNPAGVLLGGNSIYAGTAGTALKADAVTGAIAYGATHFNKKFLWRMQWQWTSAPVAWEARYMLTLGYTFNQVLKATIDLAYYGVHTNKGYQAGLNGPCVTYCGGGYQDRSALYTNLIASF